MTTVKRYAIALLLLIQARVSAWLLRLNPPPPPPPPPAPAPAPEPDPLDVRAKALVADVERLDASGEYKRHTVYARLLKEFPMRRKRDVGLAIETALQVR